MLRYTICRRSSALSDIFKFQITRSFASSRTGRHGNQQNDRRHLWLLVIPVTTFGLGTWQIFRLRWKVDLIDRLEQRTLQSPVTMPSDISDRLEEFEYRRVVMRGRFDHTHELLMWPRTQINEGQSRPNPEPGAFVITPFYCNETKSYVLVNRGWVPRNKMDPSTRPDGQIEGDIVLTAIVRTEESRGLFGPKNDPERNYWAWRDVKAMSQYANTDPVLLDADATSTVAGGPIGGQTKVTLRNEYSLYIITGYVLCVTTGYLFWRTWQKVKKK